MHLHHLNCVLLDPGSGCASPLSIDGVAFWCCYLVDFKVLNGPSRTNGARPLHFEYVTSSHLKLIGVFISDVSYNKWAIPLWIKFHTGFMSFICKTVSLSSVLGMFPEHFSNETRPPFWNGYKHPIWVYLSPNMEGLSILGDRYTSTELKNKV